MPVHGDDDWVQIAELDEPREMVEHWAVEWSKYGNCHEPPHRAGTA